MRLFSLLPLLLLSTVHAQSAKVLPVDPEDELVPTESVPKTTVETVYELVTKNIVHTVTESSANVSDGAVAPVETVVVAQAEPTETKAVVHSKVAEADDAAHFVVKDISNSTATVSDEVTIPHNEPNVPVVVPVVEVIIPTESVAEFETTKAPIVDSIVKNINHEEDTASEETATVPAPEPTIVLVVPEDTVAESTVPEAKTKLVTIVNEVREQSVTVTEPHPTVIVEQVTVTEPQPTVIVEQVTVTEPQPTVIVEQVTVTEPQPTVIVEQVTVTEPQPTAIVESATVTEPLPTVVVETATVTEPFPTVIIESATATKPQPTVTFEEVTVTERVTTPVVEATTATVENKIEVVPVRRTTIETVYETVTRTVIHTVPAPSTTVAPPSTIKVPLCSCDVTSKCQSESNSQMETCMESCDEHLKEFGNKTDSYLECFQQNDEGVAEAESCLFEGLEDRCASGSETTYIEAAPINKYTGFDFESKPHKNIKTNSFWNKGQREYSRFQKFFHCTKHCLHKKTHSCVTANGCRMRMPKREKYQELMVNCTKKNPKIAMSLLKTCQCLAYKKDVKSLIGTCVVVSNQYFVDNV